MPATMLLRISGQLMSALMGGFAIFCFYYAAQLENPDVVQHLFILALKWGGCATALVYCQAKYLQ